MPKLDRIQVDGRAPTADDFNRLQTNIERALGRLATQLSETLNNFFISVSGSSSTTAAAQVPPAWSDAPDDNVKGADIGLWPPAMQAGRDGQQGRPGLDGTDGQDGADGVAGLAGRDGLDGRAGRDGIDGQDGQDGVDGKPGQDGALGASGRDGIDGVDGQEGAEGIRGRDGVDGQAGRPGADGADGQDASDAMAPRDFMGMPQGAAQAEIDTTGDVLVTLNADGRIRSNYTRVCVGPFTINSPANLIIEDNAVLGVF